MAQISFGGDPEEYMDPPRMSTGSGGSGNGVNFVNGLLDLLGIHRNVARGPKIDKMTSKTVKTSIPKTAKASDFLDATGAALLKNDVARDGTIKTIDLPPSSARQGI